MQEARVLRQRGDFRPGNSDCGETVARSPHFKLLPESDFENDVERSRVGQRQFNSPREFSEASG